MCEDCGEFPVRYVAYFNKAGGKMWRPAQKVAPHRRASDDASAEPTPKSREFACVEAPVVHAVIAPSSVANHASLDDENIATSAMSPGIA